MRGARSCAGAVTRDEFAVRPLRGRDVMREGAEEGGRGGGKACKESPGERRAICRVKGGGGQSLPASGRDGGGGRRRCAEAWFQLRQSGSRNVMAEPGRCGFQPRHGLGDVARLKAAPPKKGAHCFLSHRKAHSFAWFRAGRRVPSPPCVCHAHGKIHSPFVPQPFRTAGRGLPALLGPDEYEWFDFTLYQFPLLTLPNRSCLFGKLWNPGILALRVGGGWGKLQPVMRCCPHRCYEPGAG